VEPIGSRQILVVARDLDPSRPLEEGDLTSQDIPDTEEFRALWSRAYKPDERRSLAGARVNRQLASGQPLLYADTAAVQELRFADTYRALAISVGSEGTFGGLLVPGDRVDVVATFALEPEIPEQTAAIDPSDAAAMMQMVLSTMNPARTTYTSEVVASEVRVLAIGGNLSGTRSDLRFFTGEDGGRDRSSLVVLEVDEEQALRLLAKSGSSASSLSLLLRSPGRGPSR